MTEWLTITELAEQTSIPETTIRRYVKLFKTFFKTSGGTRSRRYEEQSVLILVRIKNLYDEGRDTEEISRMITTEFPMVIDDNVVRDNKPSAQVLPTAEDVEELRQSLRNVTEQLKRQEEFNMVLVQKLDQLPQYISEQVTEQVVEQVITRSRKERIELEQEKERARIEMAATLNPKKSWWQRLIGK